MLRCPGKTNQTNQHAAVPNFLFIHATQMFAAFLCLQHNTQEFSDRGRSNEKTTANSMRQTEHNNARSVWRGACFGSQMTNTDF